MKRDEFAWTLLVSAALGAALAGCARDDRAKADAASPTVAITSEEIAAATALPFAFDDPAFPSADVAGPDAAAPPLLLIPGSNGRGDLQPNPS